MEQPQHRIGVSAAIDRLHLGLAIAAVAAVQLLHLHLLDMGAVGQHDAAKRRRGRGGMDAAPEPVAPELGQKTGMVDMGMGQQDRRNSCRIKGKGAPV